MKNYVTFRLFAISLFLAGSVSAWAQTCQRGDEIPEAARKSVESAAQQAFDQTARGDVQALQTSAIPSLQSNFAGIAGAVNDNKDAIQGAKPQLRAIYLLDTGANPGPDGTFYCGVFGANGMNANTAEFDLPGIPVGKYAIAIQDFIGNKGPYTLSIIFQDLGGWKVAGYQIRPGSVAGHDGLWYLVQARDYKNKGQAHNAWFYYQTSLDLLSPATYMSSNMLAKINDESSKVLPKDVPAGGKPVTFSAGGKTYNITDMSVFRNDKNFDLSLKYSVPSTADFNATQADARNLANAMVAQYPELKDGFNNIWVHAVDANGGDVVGLVKLK
ncbi:MAG TPA: hypothetical protein VGJ33_13290 [Candidatus Angelobacter sp.]|jgi:hypothetical protein